MAEISKIKIKELVERLTSDNVSYLNFKGWEERFDGTYPVLDAAIEDRRAKIINAEGEYQAATRLAEAAGIIQKYPEALQLRYLQTLREIAAEGNSTTLFPIPIDLLIPFIKKSKKIEGGE